MSATDATDAAEVAVGAIEAMRGVPMNVGNAMRDDLAATSPDAPTAALLALVALGRSAAVGVLCVLACAGQNSAEPPSSNGPGRG